LKKIAAEKEKNPNDKKNIQETSELNK